MAKRGTLEHPKVRRLSRRIGMPGWAALGLLESLWQWVGRYAPTGFVDSEALRDAADTIRFEGDLAAILPECGLLDIVDGGFYIHDWHDHADDTVKKTLEKRGESFANGSSVRTRSVREPSANDSRTDTDPKSRLTREQVANDSRTIRDKPSQKPVASSRKPEASDSAASAAGAAAPPGKPNNPPNQAPDPPPREPSEPFASVQAVLMGIAQLLDLPEPTSEEVRRHIAASSPLRKVMEKYGVETTVDLYCFAAKTVPRGGLDWGAIWGQNAALAAQMRDGPPAKGGRPSIIEQTNKALEIIRSAEPESNSEYSAAAAAILAGQVPPC